MNSSDLNMLTIHECGQSGGRSLRLLTGIFCSILYSTILIAPASCKASCEYSTPRERNLCIAIDAATNEIDCRLAIQEPNPELSEHYLSLCTLLSAAVKWDCGRIEESSGQKVCVNLLKDISAAKKFQKTKLLSEWQYQFRSKLIEDLENPVSDYSDKTVSALAVYIYLNYPLYQDKILVSYNQRTFIESFNGVIQAYPNRIDPSDLEKTALIAAKMGLLRPRKNSETQWINEATGKRINMGHEAKFSTALDVVVTLRLLPDSIKLNPGLYPPGTIIEGIELPGTLITGIQANDEPAKCVLLLDNMIVYLPGTKERMILPLAPIGSGSSKDVWMAVDDDLKVVTLATLRSDLPAESTANKATILAHEFQLRRKHSAHKEDFNFLQIDRGKDLLPKVMFTDLLAPLQYEQVYDLVFNSTQLNGYPTDLIKAYLAYTCIREVTNLHYRRLVHRDVKLENFVFNWKDGLIEARLVDYGSVYDLDLIESSPNASRTPYALGFFGSVQYISPEVARCRKDDPKANCLPRDVWALGNTLYSLCVNSSQPHGLLCSHSEIYDKLQYVKNYDDLFKIIGFDVRLVDYLDGLGQIIRKMLDPDSKTRITSWDALEEAKALLVNELSYNPRTLAMKRAQETEVKDHSVETPYQHSLIRAENESKTNCH